MKFRNYIKNNKDTIKTISIFYLLLIICTLFVINYNQQNEKNSTTVQENAILITK